MSNPVNNTTKPWPLMEQMIAEGTALRWAAWSVTHPDRATSDPRPFRSRAFDGAHAAVKREQAAFREMLKTYRAPPQKASGDE